MAVVNTNVTISQKLHHKLSKFINITAQCDVVVWRYCEHRLQPQGHNQLAILDDNDKSAFVYDIAGYMSFHSRINYRDHDKTATYIYLYLFVGYAN